MPRSRGLRWVTRWRAVGLTAVMALLVSLLAATHAAAASELFVDQNNPRCSNTGQGTATTPYCTIGKAASVAIAGQTVTVLSGTYVENVTPASSGTSAAPITFRAGPGETVTVTGATRAFTVSAKSWITITGFHVTGTADYGIYLKNASHVTVANNEVDHAGQPIQGDTAQGIYLTGTTASSVLGNTVHHNTDSGIYLTSGSTGNLIQGNESFSNARGYTRAAPGIDVRAASNVVTENTTYGNEDSGIQIYNGGNGSQVTGNLIYDNGDHGIDVLNSTNVVVVSNTVYNSKTSGINIEGATGSTASSGATVRNNISVDNGLTSTSTKGNIRVDAKSTTGTTLDYDLLQLSSAGTVVTWGSTQYTSLGAFSSATGQENHGLQADPKFKAPGSDDFHLSGGSPAIDSAASNAPGQPAQDLDGLDRVDDPGTPNIGVGPRTYDDRGAYEYHSNLPPQAALTVSPSTGDAPLAVTADAGASTDPQGSPIASYAFSFGDGSAGTGPQPGPTATHTYTTPGSYTVTVTVTDGLGLSSTATAAVEVSSADKAPQAALTVTPDAGTAPLDVTADATGSTDTDSTPIATYTFDFGDGSAPVGPQAAGTTTHRYTSTGSWTVTVTVKDTGGKSGTATAVVTVGSATVDEVHYSWLSSTAVTFDWRGGPDTIRYGTTSSYGQSVTASTPSPLPYSSAGPFWEAKLTGLTAGTTYHYSIGGSADATFRTAPSSGGFRFAVLADVGDTGTYPGVGPIQSMIAADHPAAVLLPGDITYGEAHGQQAVDQHFNDVMAWSRTAAYMPAWGNHDWETVNDDLRNYKGRFDIAHQQASPGAPSLGCCGEDWGWFDAGGVRFISYPEPYASNTWSDWASNAAPIMAAAQNDSSINFIVTYGHRPAYSTGNHVGSGTLAGILDNLGDTYSKYVLNLNGHSHDYERFEPIHGVTHVTAGNGGATLETPWATTDPRTAYRAMHLGYTRVDVSSTALTLSSICGPSSSKDDITCTQGSVIDSVVIPARGNDLPPDAQLTVTPSTGTAPLAVTADASASTDTDATPIESYAFDFGDGTLAGPGPSATATHTYTAVGTYTVTVTVTDTSGRPSTTTRSVTVNPSAADDPPVAKLSVSPNVGTTPLQVTADASASTDVDQTPIATYRFAWGDGTSTNDQAASTASHTYSVPGTYTVTVTVADTIGQSSTATATLTAQPVDAPPTVALSVTPTTGPAPLQVSADASGSTDTDATPIASYRFDFGDGTVVGPQAGATASHTYATAGNYTLIVRVTDTGGQSSSTTATVSVNPANGQNLIGNPGFETGTTGWNNNGRAGIALTRVTSAHSGTGAALLSNTSATSQPDCTLNDSPNWIASTQTVTYQGSVWVRADTAGAVLKIRFREYNAGAFMGSAMQQVTLTTQWQQVTVNYTAQMAGSTLDLTIYTGATPPGTCFYADDVEAKVVF